MAGHMAAVDRTIWIRTAVIGLGTWLGAFVLQISVVTSAATQDAWTAAVDSVIAAVVAFVCQMLRQWMPEGDEGPGVPDPADTRTRPIRPTGDTGPL